MNPMNPTRANRNGISRYRTFGPNGRPFVLAVDWSFRTSTATFSHYDKRSVTFRDCCGNYAKVAGVRNPVAWVKRHGYEN